MECKTKYPERLSAVITFSFACITWKWATLQICEQRRMYHLYNEEAEVVCGTLNTECSLKVKSNFSVILSSSLLLCCDTDWLVCLVWVFLSGNGERGKYYAQLHHGNNSHHRQRTTFFCVLSPFGLISPGTARFINKHKTISWLNYQQESPRRWRGRASIRGCPQFITPVSVWSLSCSHLISMLISMLWVTRSIWNGIWAWWMSRVTLKTTNRRRRHCYFIVLFFSESYPRRHTGSWKKNAILLMNYHVEEINQKDAAWAWQCQMKRQEDKAKQSLNCYVLVI